MAEALKDYVRLKPINAKQGHTNQTHIIRVRDPDGRRDDKGKPVIHSFKFEVKRGWYRLTQEQIDFGLAELLEEQLQDPTDPNSAFAFDVCTEQEARDLEAREIRARQRLLASTVDDAAAGVTTTADTRGMGLRREARGSIGRDEIRLRREKEMESQRRTEEANVRKQTVTSGVDAARPLGSLSEPAAVVPEEGESTKPAGPPPMLDPNPGQENLEDEDEEPEGRLKEIGRVETAPAVAPVAAKPVEAPAAKTDAPAPKAETTEAPKGRSRQNPK